MCIDCCMQSHVAKHVHQDRFRLLPDWRWEVGVLQLIFMWHNPPLLLKRLSAVVLRVA